MPWVTVVVTITVAITIVAVLRVFLGKPLMSNPSSATSPITATMVEFTYTPTTFLESPITQTQPDYQLEVREGAAKATLSAVQDPIPYTLIAAIRLHAESILGARQLLTHRPYKLDERPRTVQVKSDGNRNISLHTGTGALVVEGQLADEVIKDPTGKVIRDTRAERIAEHERSIKRMADAATKDALLGELMSSYRAAVDDPDNEMVHLYEIRDALKNHFRGEKPAQQAVGVSATKWERLGTLANVDPLEQSRHRGLHASGRRPATAGELQEARSIAVMLIEGFAKTL